jgi:lipoprotein-anchoring transpeptidase ErfK/SrfK
VVPELALFDAPDAPAPTRSLANPWHLNDDPDLPVDLVFLVAAKQGSWYQVYLPERPNGSTAWVRGQDVKVTQNRYRIEVNLAAHQMTVYDGDSVFLQEPVAIGADETPTPTGTYYVRVLLRNPNPGNVYGPFAYGLSGHSDVLETFNGGDAEVGIHGNNDASVLGTSVSHGCIRMSNDGITRLTGILPLGTPVTIT